MTESRPSRSVSQREIRLEVKKTRHGKLLTFADDDAKGGLRGMTDAERKAQDYIKNLVDSFDTEPIEPGRVGTVSFSCDGQPSVEWRSEKARLAAGAGSSTKEDRNVE